MEGIERLTQVLVEVADTLVEGFDVADFLQLLAERCAELLDADAAGLMLVDDHGDLQVVAATLEPVRALELLELRNREGPCLESFRTGAALANVDLAAAVERWPALAPAALAMGFRTTHALPLRLRGRCLGALNLFAAAQVHLGAEQVSVGQVVADVATIALLQERSVREKTVLSEQLQRALSSRVLVEQAKGVLAEREGTTVAEAFTRLRAHARSTGTPLTAVASGVVDGTLDLPARARPAGGAADR